MKTFQIIYAPIGQDCPEWQVCDSEGDYWGRYWSDSTAEDRVDQLTKLFELQYQSNIAELAN